MNIPRCHGHGGDDAVIRAASCSQPPGRYSTPSSCVPPQVVWTAQKRASGRKSYSNPYKYRIHLTMERQEAIIMLHNGARKLRIKAWNKTHNAKEVAEYFGVNTSTVCRLEKRMRETMVSQRGRKSALSQTDLQNIDQTIQAPPDITIHEIREGLQLPVSDETVRRVMAKMGYIYKKKSLHNSEQERPRCQEQAGRVEKPCVGERRR